MKYNDNGEYKDIYVKAFDTLPIGTQVNFNGTSADIPNGWEQVGTSGNLIIIEKTSQYIEGGATLSNEYGTSQTDGFTQNYFDIKNFTTYTSSDMTITNGSFDSDDVSTTSLKIGLNEDKTLAVIGGLIQFHKSSWNTTIKLQTDIRPSKNITLPRFVIQRTVDNNMVLLRNVTINTSGEMSITSNDLQSQTQFNFLCCPIMLKVYENIN